jgi:hypothetical protein
MFCRTARRRPARPTLTSSTRPSGPGRRGGSMACSSSAQWRWPTSSTTTARRRSSRRGDLRGRARLGPPCTASTCTTRAGVPVHRGGALIAQGALARRAPVVSSRWRRRRIPGRTHRLQQQQVGAGAGGRGRPSHIVVDSFAGSSGSRPSWGRRASRVLVRATVGVEAHARIHRHRTRDQKFGFSLRDGTALESGRCCARPGRPEFGGLHRTSGRRSSRPAGSGGRAPRGRPGRRRCAIAW